MKEKVALHHCSRKFSISVRKDTVLICDRCFSASQMCFSASQSGRKEGEFCELGADLCCLCSLCYLGSTDIANLPAEIRASIETVKVMSIVLIIQQDLYLKDLPVRI